MKLDDKVLQRLAGDDASLTMLLLDDNFGPRGAKSLAGALKKNQRLTLLFLKGNDISDEGAKDLADTLKTNQTLTMLSILYNNIGNVGAKDLAIALEKHLTLKQLLLGNNNIGDEGAKNLAKAFEKHQTLEHLNLESNNIGDEGAIALATALEENETLINFNLTSNNISPEGAKHLADALKKNQTLGTFIIPHNNIGTKGAKYFADALKENQSLVWLVLADNNFGPLGTKDLAAALEKNQTLQHLNLETNKLGDAGAIALAIPLKKNQTLKSLTLKDNNIASTGAKYLADALKENQTLTRLTLANNNIGPLGAKYLAAVLDKNTSLMTLELENNNIGPEGTKDLVKALQNNFVLSEIKGVDLPEEAYDRLIRNRALHDIQQRMTANLEKSRKMLSIPQEDSADANTVLQFVEHIEMLKDNIQELETAQAEIGDNTSKSALKIKEDLQKLHDRCVSDGIKVLTIFGDVMKDDFDTAVDNIVERIPESSPLFNHARFLLFQAAYSGYQNDNYPPTQAFVEALPLLRKEDGTLLTDFITASKDIEGMLFKPTEQQRIFDSMMLAAAGHDVEPAEEVALSNIERADLLRFALLRYTKDIATETDIKHSKIAGTLFADTKKEIPPRLRKSLISLSSSFDVTKAEERENVRKLFDEAYGDLKDLLSENPKETQAIKDLKNCHELMTPLSTKPITPDVSPKPEK